VRRPVAVAVAVAALAVAGGLLALRLQPSVDADTLVDRGSPTFRATEDYHKRFGDDAVFILVRGPVTQLVLTQDIERLLGLEGCISGNVPAGVAVVGGPRSACAAFARHQPKLAQVVYGPATFLNEAVRQIQDQFGRQQQDEAAREARAGTAARKLAAAQHRSAAAQARAGAEARQLVQAQFLRNTLALALTYGIRSVPRLNDPEFVSTVVFDPARGANVPKARFAYLFPNANSALVQVRLAPELTTTERRRAIELIRRATKMPEFRLAHGGRYTVTGAPVVLAGLTASITQSIGVLLVAALVVMTATLALVFRVRRRLLPLGIALAGAGLTFGGMRLAGATLTMASIAVLPVLIGLGVDYAIQLQSRFEEERARGPGSAAGAARRAALAGAPTIAAAGLATAAGFLVLVLSPVPMVRSFGILLVIGMFVGFACALTAGFAVMTLGSERSARPAATARGLRTTAVGAARAAGELLAAAGRGARDVLLGDPRRTGPRVHEAVLRRRAAAFGLDAGLLAGFAALLDALELSTPEVVAGSAIAAVAYLVVIQGRTGGTLGKLLAGVRTIDAGGQPPGLRRSIVRCGALVPDLLGVVALPSMLTSKHRRRLGDRWAQTTVVLDPRSLEARVSAVGRGALDGLTRAARAATRQPERVLGVGVVLALLGVGLDTQTPVVSDVQRLVPQDVRSLRDLNTLQRSTGVSGEIDVTVAARDLTDPRVVTWMTRYQQELLKRYGYSPARGCGKAKLCPALSLPDLFRSTTASNDRRQIQALLDAVPPYFSQAVISRDRRVATMAFGIRLMPLDRQQAVIDEMRRQLHPPRGVTARLAGLPVLAAQANRDVSAQWRRLLTLLIGLAAVALVLLAVFRRAERALVPLVPIVLASGWSALVLFLLRVPLNPMSVTLGALVIAISTEFSVLLAERYRQERAAGHPPHAALDRTYASTGRAVLASGATAIAGFAVLVVSDIRMLREFGFVTVVDLAVSLVGVMVVLPAVLFLADRGELTALPVRAWRRLGDALPRLRRARSAT
jgi:predicted RND superfamily exporter protein